MIEPGPTLATVRFRFAVSQNCLLYTSDAADERSSVDLGGRRIIKKTQNNNTKKQYHYQPCKYKDKQLKHHH